MNIDQIKGKWKQLRGAAKSKWGKLTDDDWKVAEGDAEKLAGRIQERYGNTKELAHKEINEMLEALK